MLQLRELLHGAGIVLQKPAHADSVDSYVHGWGIEDPAHHCQWYKVRCNSLGNVMRV